MKKLVLFTFLFIFILISQSYAHYFTSCSDFNGHTYINESTSMDALGTCYINDTVDYGVFIINTSNIVFDCNSTTFYGNTSGFTIYVRSISYDTGQTTTIDNITIQNCTIDNYHVGIYVYNATNVNIINNTVYNSSSVRLQSGSNNSHIINNTFRLNKDYAVKIVDTENVSVDNNFVFDGGTWGVIEPWKSYNINITGNYLNHTTGIYYDGGGYLRYGGVIRDNIINNSYKYSNHAGSLWTEWWKNLTIINNTVENSYIGLHLMRNYNTVAANNTLIENTYGIYLDMNENITIENNSIYNSTRMNLYIYGTDPITLNYTFNNKNNTINDKYIDYKFNVSDVYIDSIPNNISHMSFVYSNNITITNLTTGLNDPIEFIYTDNSKIVNSNITNSSYSIRLVSSSNNIIENNSINSDYTGIWIENDGRSFYNGTDSPDSSNNVIKNNTIVSDSYGILLAGSGSNQVENNNIYNSSAGIYLKGWTSIYSGVVQEYPTNNSIVNNIINSNSNSEYGIYLDHALNNTITNNTANSNTYHGTYLQYSSNNNITNNTFNLNKHQGIYLNLDSNYNNIINNTANSNIYYGIVVYSSSNNTLTNNTANSNSRRGIYLYSNSNDNIIESNIISNTKYSIYLESSHNNEISNNNITLSSIYDIYDKSSTNNIYTNININGTNFSATGYNFAIKEVYDNERPSKIYNISTYINATK